MQHKHSSHNYEHKTGSAPDMKIVGASRVPTPPPAPSSSLFGAISMQHAERKGEAGRQAGGLRLCNKQHVNRLCFSANRSRDSLSDDNHLLHAPVTFLGAPFL